MISFMFYNQPSSCIHLCSIISSVHVFMFYNQYSSCVHVLQLVQFMRSSMFHSQSSSYVCPCSIISPVLAFIHGLSILSYIVPPVNRQCVPNISFTEQFSLLQKNVYALKQNRSFCMVILHEVYGRFTKLLLLKAFITDSDDQQDIT